MTTAKNSSTQDRKSERTKRLATRTAPPRPDAATQAKRTKSSGKGLTTSPPEKRVKIGPPPVASSTKRRGEPPLVDLREIPSDGDEWEAFSRDFLVALGFAIETPPNRGADGGKDLIVSESLRGKLSRYPLRWMVSCKHKAHSEKAVTEADEPNILERLKSVECDAFIGMYSTVTSSGLAERLRLLREKGDIRDYRIFDAKLIENHLVRLGFSTLVLRYFPLSYRRLKPLHAIAGEYRALNCAVCGRDMLEARAVVGYHGMIGFVRKPRKADQPEQVVDIYWACKGACDRSLDHVYQKRGLMVGWEDISDIAIPTFYLRWILGVANVLRAGTTEYGDRAYDKLKEFLIAMAQRVMREMTEEERQRFKVLLETPML